MIVSNPKERGRFVRFAIVGAIGAGVDFSVFNLLVVAGRMLPVAASVISFSLAVVSNFVLNRYWTYPDSRSKAVHHQMVQFGVISLIGLGIRTPLFAWTEPVFVNLLSTFSRTLRLPPSFLGHNLALSLAILVVMLWNFFANRFWTFSDVK